MFIWSNAHYERSGFENRKPGITRISRSETAVLLWSIYLLNSFFYHFPPTQSELDVAICDFKFKNSLSALFERIFPFVQDAAVAVECMFRRYWLVDVCAEHKIPFVFRSLGVCYSLTSEVHIEVRLFFYGTHGTMPSFGFCSFHLQNDSKSRTPSSITA